MMYNVLRYYNRLCKMETERLPKMVYNACKNTPGTWAHEVGGILSKYNLHNSWQNNECVDLDGVKNNMKTRAENETLLELANKPKLQYLGKLKRTLKVSDYVKLDVPKHERSLISRLRNGSLHLRVETGRYNREDRNDRICELCAKGIEDEIHFLYDCEKYETVRYQYLDRGKFDKNQLDKVYENPYKFGKMISKMWGVRQNLLYVKK